MKPRHRFTHCLALAAWLAVTASQAGAQSANARGAGKTDDRDTAVANYRAFTSEARGHAQAGRLAAAEQAVAKAVVAKPGTAVAEMELAQRLLQVAEQLARNGTPQNVAPLASRALAHLQTAAALATSPEERGDIQMMAGMISERYLADTAGALTSYQAAAKLNPASKRAAEFSERAQKATEAAKGKGK